MSSQVSYVKAVDVYLWTSFMFVFLSVIDHKGMSELMVEFMILTSLMHLNVSLP